MLSYIYTAPYYRIELHLPCHVATCWNTRMIDLKTRLVYHTGSGTFIGQAIRQDVYKQDLVYRVCLENLCSLEVLLSSIQPHWTLATTYVNTSTSSDRTVIMPHHFIFHQYFYFVFINSIVYIIVLFTLSVGQRTEIQFRLAFISFPVNICYLY